MYRLTVTPIITMARRCWIAAHVLTALGIPCSRARAQTGQPARVQLSDPPVTCRTSTDLDVLAGTYYGGDWNKAEQDFEAALRSCFNSNNIDTEHNYYLVEFVSAVGSTSVASGNGGGVQPQIIHFLAHAGQSDFRLVVPGLSPSNPSKAQCAANAPADGLLLEVFLSSTKEANLATTANESRVPSGLVANAGAFFQQIGGGPFWPITAAAAATPNSAPAPTYARIGCIPVLSDNGPIALSELATTTQGQIAVTDLGRLGDQIKAVHDKYASLGSELDACAARVNETLFGYLPLPAGTDWKAIPAMVLAKAQTVTSAAPCTGGATPVGFQQTQAIIADYIAAMAGVPPAQVNGSTTVINAAKVHFRFSAVVGGLVGAGQGNEPVKVNSGSYEAHPLSRGMTMAALAWYPIPFDSTAPKMAHAERFAFIGGPVLTPTGGLGVGAAVTLLRGFAISGGYSWLLVAKAPSGLHSGDTVPTSGRQLATGIQSFGFIAGSYVFGK